MLGRLRRESFDVAQKKQTASFSAAEDLTRLVLSIRLTFVIG
jgi:hypothetical protein